MRARGVAWLTAEEIRASREAARSVVTCHLDRIRDHNPQLAAYIHVDAAAKAGSGDLTGVTIAVKDTYPVASMPWTYGSPKWRHRVAEEDAVPVARARAAGAAILGKTNLPELAAAVGTSNELFPPTHNPWRAGFTPGGSSGGSAAAVAAGLCTIAFGDDMGGSIRIPAACCGVAGLRPSPYRVPEELPDPIRLSVRGPLARSVGDLRVAFSTMAAIKEPAADQRTPWRLAVVSQSSLPVDPACQAACQRAASALAAAGHQLHEVSWDPIPIARSYQVVRPASVSTMPGEPADYGAATGRLIAQGREISARDYLAAMSRGLAAAQPLRDLVADHDAVLTPTLGRLPMPIEDVPSFLSEAWLGYTQFMLAVSYAGLPAVSLPAGLHEGLPVGVQLIGRAREELSLLRFAEQLEKKPGFGFQPPPGFD